MLQAGPLLINEFMAVNDGPFADEDGDFSDWIEIHNPTDAPVELDGWYLTDDRTDLTQWSFPDVTLEANGYLLVFASDKDRRTATGPLHTNFKLTGDGEYLGLVQPDGITLAHEFAPLFPEQSEGVSYGLLEDPTILEPALGDLRFLVPTADDAAAEWTVAGFDDSAWGEPDGGPTVLITEAGTDKLAYFELQNVSETTVDTRGWFVILGKGDSNDINLRHNTRWMLPDSMAPGQALYSTDSWFDNYFGESVQWAPGLPGWAMVVDNHGWAVDFIPWNYTEAEVAALDLKDVDGYDIGFDEAGWSGPGVPTSATGPTLQRIGNIDYDDASGFAFATSQDDRGLQNPGLTLPVSLATIPGIGFSRAFGGTLDADVGDEMRGIQSSLWARFPFEVADRDEFDSFMLQMNYSDGFVAYLNGQEVARRNAPEVIAWNSAATASRTAEEAMATEYIDISGDLELVENGTNTLAIHLLSAGTDDLDLIVRPVLAGASIRRLSRAFPMPTPGTPNTAGYVVINEVHYDPEPTTDRTEFIELFNNTNAPLDVSGWQLADGVEYTFPDGTSIPARGYLVVAEIPAAIDLHFGVTALGPWLGRLENAGERILLRDAAGRTQDEVTYKSTFPWPIAAQGEGSSMELIYPELDNDLGGSWRPSGYNALLSGELIDLEDAEQGKPTPGRRNSVWTRDEPPQIRQVKHSPKQPATGDPATDEPIAITAKVTDFNGVAEVTLSYQLVMPGNYIPAWLALDSPTLMGNPTKAFDPNPAFEDPANWTNVAMTDDGTGGDAVAGDGIYTGRIPAQATNRTLVRYRITATDTDNVSARVPHLDDPSLNFALYVYDGVPDYVAATRSVLGTGHVYDSEMLTSLPVYSLITDAADMTQAIGYNSADRIPKSNEPARDRFNWEGTFVYDGIVYDHARYRLRQANDRYGTSGKRSMRIRFPKGNYLQARDNYGNLYPEKWRTLNTGKMFDNKRVGNFGLTETLNQKLWNMVGVPSPWMHTFHFRVVDGIEEAPTGLNGQYYGDFWGMFVAIEDYDSRFLNAHDMPDGNLYKLKDGQFNGDDLKRHQGLDSVTTDADFQNIRSSLRPSQSDEWLNLNVDYDRAYWYHAVVEGIRHYDFRPADSHSKNRAWFFEPYEGSIYGRLWTLPWDSDASWGPNWNSGLDYSLNAITANGGKPEFEQDYRNVLREFRDLVWTNEAINLMIDDLASFVIDFSSADRDRWKDAPANAGRGDFGPITPKIQDMRNFAFTGWSGSTGPTVGAGGRAAYLDQLANADGDRDNLPNTPTITYTGPADFAIDALSFQTTAFADPQGNDTFAAMQWRIGEVTDPTAPAYNPNEPRIYEFPAVWQSDELTTQVDSITVPGSKLQVGHAYRARVRMKDDSGRWGHWSEPIQLIAGEAGGPVADSLRITEIMYHPTDPTAEELAVDPTFRDNDFEFIELQNISDQPIDLSGITLSDGIAFDFTTAAVTTLEPHQSVVVVKNEAAFTARYGTQTADGQPILIAGEYPLDRLSNSGERIALTDADGQPILAFKYDDSGDWTDLADGRGTSLVLIDPTAVPQSDPERTDFLEDGSNWRPSGPIGGSPGGDDEAIGIVINEVLTHTDEPRVDAIELHNTTEATIDLGGWYLSDSGNNYRKFRIPDGTTLVGGGYLYFTENDFNPTPLPPGGVRFALSGAHGDDVWLMRVDGTGQLTHYVDHVEFGAAALHESFGRWPDGSGKLYPMTSNTLGAANSGPRVGPVIFSEIHYNPSDPVNVAVNANDLEYVEIFNPTNATVPLTDWRIRGGIDFDFAIDTALDPQASLVVVSFDPNDVANGSLRNAFRTTYAIAASVPLVGPYSGKLNNGGETIRLQRPDASPADEPTFIPRLLEDEVRYDDEAPWPTEPDGQGVSLNRTGVLLWGNDAASWTFATPTPGTTELDVAAAAVVGRHVFYNNSRFDGDDPAANASDDSAIATDKQALLPGGTAQFANYTSYTRGINGLMIDLLDPDDVDSLTAADFALAVGNDNDPNGWAPAPEPLSITVRQGAGAGGADRVTFRWMDNAIENQWLQVTVMATPATGLLAPDVFYFGNAIGEAGDQAINAIVNATDEIAARTFPHGPLNPAAIDDRYDYNRDKQVNGTDQIAARSNQTNPLTMLRLISAPAVDLALKQAVMEDQDASVALSAALDWQFEYESLRSKDAASKRSTDVEATVDMLLATDWT